MVDEAVVETLEETVVDADDDCDVVAVLDWVDVAVV